MCIFIIMNRHLNKTFEAKYTLSNQNSHNKQGQENILDQNNMNRKTKIDKLSNQPYRQSQSQRKYHVDDSFSKERSELNNSHYQGDSSIRLTALSKVIKNNRQYRQFITKLPQQEHPGQCFAYCIVCKQSNSGIFAHDRLLLFDSFTQELRYYSNIPTLPITDINQLWEKSKDAVKIKNVLKFSFTIQRHGISNNVIISWQEQGVKRQWKLAMGSKKIAMQFNELVNSVIRRDNLVQRGIYPPIRSSENTQYKKNDGKSTQKHQISLSHSKKPDKQSQIIYQITNKQKQEIFTKKQIEKLKKVGSKEPLLNNQQQLRHLQISSANHNLKKMEKITPREQTDQLSKILKNRSQKIQQSSKISYKNDEIINKIAKNKINESIHQTQNITGKRNSKNYQQQYLDGKNKFQDKQQEEAKIIFNYFDSNRKRNNTNNLQYSSVSSRDSAKQNSIYNSLQIRGSFTNNQPSFINKIFWIDKWLTAKTQHEKADIYCKFVEKCSSKIKSMMKKFYNVHLMNTSSEKGIYLIEDDEINFTYVLLIQSTEDYEQSHILISKMRDQQKLLNEFDNFNLIWNASNTTHEKYCPFSAPLACIIRYKSISFLCKAALSSCSFQKKIIFNTQEYTNEFLKFETRCHVEIINQNKQLIQITNNDHKYLYFERLNCNFSKSEQLYHPISIKYINRYIIDGTIQNSSDRQAIQIHIRQTLIKIALKQLQKIILVSCIDLKQVLKKYGIHDHWLPEMYKQSQLNQKTISSIILTQMICIVLEANIRRSIQVQIFKNKDIRFSIEKIYHCLSSFFKKQKLMFQTLHNLFQQYFKIQIPKIQQIIDKNITLEYLFISILIKLGVKCKLTNFPSLHKLENIKVYFWINHQICQDNIVFQFVICNQLYDYNCFNNNFFFLKERLFDIGVNCTQSDITQQSVLSKFNMNYQQNRCINLSAQYKILPAYLQAIINYYLSNYISSSNQQHIQHIDTKIQSKSCLQNIMYQNLLINNTCYFSSYYEFAVNIAGIKWFIKNKNNEFAELMLMEQLQCALIWVRNIPEMLIELYDLYAIFSLTRKKYANAIQFALKSLKLVINFYSESQIAQKQLLIAQKALLVANIQFQSNQFQKSLQFYQTAQKLITKVNSTQLEWQQLNIEHLIIYVRKCILYISFGDIKLCLQQCLKSLKRCDQIRRKFKSTVSEQFDIKINQYQIDIYCILFRCYQIKNKRKQMYQISVICCLKYYQDRVIITHQFFQQIPFTQQSLLKQFCEIIKMVWLSIVKNSEMNNFSQDKNVIDFELHIKEIKLSEIRQQLIKLRKRLNYQYRYSQNEIYAFITRKICRKNKQNKNINQKNQKSILIRQIIDCFWKLSNMSTQTRIYRLYQQEANENSFMFLQAMTVLAGYEYLIGCIESSLHIYNFQI